jgi:hypothetical protein
LIFERLTPLPSLIEVAPIMGWEVLEIEIEKSLYSQAVAKVLDLLSKNNISIMEIFSRNLRQEDSKAYIVIDGTIPVEVFIKIKDTPGFKKLILHTPEKRKENFVCAYCEVRYCPKKVVVEKS